MFTSFIQITWRSVVKSRSERRGGICSITGRFISSSVRFHQRTCSNSHPFTSLYVPCHGIYQWQQRSRYSHSIASWLGGCHAMCVALIRKVQSGDQRGVGSVGYPAITILVLLSISKGFLPWKSGLYLSSIEYWSIDHSGIHRYLEFTRFSPADHDIRVIPPIGICEVNSEGVQAVTNDRLKRWYLPVGNVELIFSNWLGRLKEWTSMSKACKSFFFFRNICRKTLVNCQYALYVFQKWECSSM